MTPQLSIITVVHNGARYIEGALRSVARQNYPHKEHIVIDGGSTDGTVEILQRHRDPAPVLVSEPDHGIYDAMNKGIALAQGDVIGFLNADDLYMDEHVLEEIAAVFEDPGVDACYADLVYVAQDDPTCIRRYWKSRPYEVGLFRRGWMVAHPTFYVRRAVYERLGGFDLRYKIQSDFELAMRFLEIHRIRSVYVPRIWVRMRVGGESNRHVMNVVRGNLEAYRACRRHGINVTPLFLLRKVLMRLPQFLRRPRTVQGPGS